MVSVLLIWGGVSNRDGVGVAWGGVGVHLGWSDVVGVWGGVHFRWNVMPLWGDVSVRDGVWRP